MIEDLINRGVLSEMGLPQEAVMNVIMPLTPPPTSTSAAGSSSYAQGQQRVVEVLTTWIKAAGQVAGTTTAATAKGLVGATATVQNADDPMRLQMFKPVGQVLMFEGSNSNDGSSSSSASGSGRVGKRSNGAPVLTGPIRM